MDGYETETGEIVTIPRSAVPAQGERNLIFASPDCGEIFGALAEAQGEMSNPKKTKTAKVQGTTKSGGSYSYDYKYAPLEEVMDVIRAPMAKAGLVYRQFLAQRDSNWIMRTIIAHRSGQWYGCDYPIFVGRQEGAQGFASGVTYARRYGLMMALGLVGEDDDDANVADGRPAEIVSGRAGARGAGSGRQSAGKAEQAAPAASNGSADIAKRRQDARLLWGKLAKDITEAPSLPELETIDGSQMWQDLEAELNRLEPPETAAQAIETLRGRIEDRRVDLGGYGA